MLKFTILNLSGVIANYVISLSNLQYVLENIHPLVERTMMTKSLRVSNAAYTCVCAKHLPLYFL